MRQKHLKDGKRKKRSVSQFSVFFEERNSRTRLKAQVRKEIQEALALDCIDCEIAEQFKLEYDWDAFDEDWCEHPDEPHDSSWDYPDDDWRDWEGSEDLYPLYQLLILQSERKVQMTGFSKVFETSNGRVFNTEYDKLTNSRFNTLDCLKQTMTDDDRGHVNHMRNEWIVIHYFHEGRFEIWKPMTEKVVRTLTYEGPTERVDEQLRRCFEDGVHMIGGVKLTVETTEGQKREGIRLGGSNETL